MNTDQEATLKSEISDLQSAVPEPREIALTILLDKLRLLTEAADRCSHYLHGESIDRTAREVRDDLDSAICGGRTYLQSAPAVIADNWLRMHRTISQIAIRKHRENARLREALQYYATCCHGSLNCACTFQAAEALALEPSAEAGGQGVS